MQDCPMIWPSSNLICHLYLLFGHIFVAPGDAGDLNRSWWDSTSAYMLYAVSMTHKLLGAWLNAFFQIRQNLVKFLLAFLL